MKRRLLLMMLLLTASSAQAQHLPAVLDSIPTGYRDVIRVGPGYIVALRDGAMDVRAAAANSMGTLNGSMPFSDLTPVTGRLAKKGSTVYVIGSRITPVNMAVPAAPVAGTPLLLHEPVTDALVWNDLLLVSAGFRTYVYSISVPAAPVLLDSVNLTLAELCSYGNRLYARKTFGRFVYNWSLSPAAPHLLLNDSVDLGDFTISVTIADNQLLAKNTDSLYRFDLTAAHPFHLLAAEKLPGYPTNGRLVAFDTVHIGYAKYNSFWTSYGHTGNSFTDSFSLGYGDYYMGHGRLDNSVFYGDVQCTRLIGFRNATGFQSPAAAPEFDFFPNPVSNVLHVRLRRGVVADYIIMNAQGRVVLNGKLTSQAPIINMEQLAAGVYLVEVQEAGGGRGVQTVVKG